MDCPHWGRVDFNCRINFLMVKRKTLNRNKNYFIYSSLAHRIQYSIERQAGHTDSINQRRTTSYLAFAIVTTIITVIIWLVIFVLRKRIQLVIELFKEAGKAIGSMPILLFEPILVSFIIGLEKRKSFLTEFLCVLDFPVTGSDRWSVGVLCHMGRKFWHVNG